MLKFFRRTRQNLLSENKFSKYIVYAIGEILLVMIGILLALQVNNWNEVRKERIYERKMLMELKVELSQNHDSFQNKVDRYTRQAAICDRILGELGKEKVYSDSFLQDIIAVQFLSLDNSKRSVFQTLKSNGFDFIRSDTIKALLTDIYDKVFPTIANLHERQTKVLEDNLSPMIHSHFAISEDENRAQPLNYAALREDVVFKNWIITHRMHLRRLANFYSVIAMRSDALILEIDHYLSE